MTGAVRHPGMILGVGRFFHDPRGSMRGVLASHPGEGRLLLYVLVAASVLLAGRIAALFGASAGTGDLSGPVTAQAYSLPFVVFAYYLLAALGTVIARLFGGRGSWTDGRAAFFWASLVSAPVVVLSGLAAVAAVGAPRAVAVGIAEAGPVFYAWAVAQCYAEAFGFRRGWVVFAVIAALVLAVVAGLWAVQP